MSADHTARHPNTAGVACPDEAAMYIRQTDLFFKLSSRAWEPG